MLGYADSTRAEVRKASPRTLGLIVAGHALLIGTVMTARMVVISDDPFTTVVETIPLTPEPPPNPPERQPDRPSQPTMTDRTPVIVPLPPMPGPTIDQQPIVTPVPQPNPGPTVVPPVRQPPKADPVRIAARLATPDALLRPPYPDAKRRLEEEARLTLRLRIDERGRVVAVDPVGPADSAFIDSARRHLIKSWRYTPATEDGRAIATTITITLRFEIEDA